MDFVTGLPSSTNWKEESYDSILDIVDRLIKIVHYKLVKITINISKLVEINLDMVVWYYDLLDLIVSDRGLLFISKFWSLLCYFLKIKQRLSIAFYL